MAESKPIHMNEVKVGKYILVDDVACIVKSLQVSRPGKHGHAKYRVEAVGIIDGSKKIFIKPGHDSIESPIIEKETAQVLSVQGDIATVMDGKTYETFDLPIPNELKNQIKEGIEVIYWIIMNDKIIKQVK
jgi:translation initiation factor 5A|tara:strand:+ start:69243 stop:69635 length:393 start_codon:yes stop_codon:yes gene_type:complete